MNLRDLETMLDYHYWARDRLFEAIATLPPADYDRDLSNSFRSIRETVVHIYAAEWVWFNRWQGNAPAGLLSSDPYPDVASIQRAWEELEPQVRALIASLGEQGVERIVEYTLFSGAAGASPMWQMVQHVVNHASYHRGQVTTMLRQLGAKPAPSQDMIAFFRSRTASV